MKVVEIDSISMSWEGLAADRCTGWRSALKQHLKTGEDKLMTAAADSVHAERRAQRLHPTKDLAPIHPCPTSTSQPPVSNISCPT